MIAVAGKDGRVMPLEFANAGETNVIKRIGGGAEVRRHLAALGFVVGGTVTVLNSMGGDLIVGVRESRVAISREMARRIMV